MTSAAAGARTVVNTFSPVQLPPSPSDDPERMVLRIDVRPFLPEGWADQLEEASDRVSHCVRRVGGGAGSLNLGTRAGLDYATAGTSELLVAVPWLSGLFVEVAPTLLRLAARDQSLTRCQGEHALTVNRVRPDSAVGGYEWHRDGADVRWVCVLTTRDWDSHRGGRFLWHDGERARQEDMRAGVMLAARTSLLPHAVEAPVHNVRVSLMLAYTRPGERREGGLTDWLGWRESSDGDGPAAEAAHAPGGAGPEPADAGPRPQVEG